MEKFQIDIKDALLRKLRWRHESYILNVAIVSVRDEFATTAAHFVEDMDELFVWIIGVLVKTSRGEEELLDLYRKARFFRKFPRYSVYGGFSKFKPTTGDVCYRPRRDPGRRE